MDKLLPCPFCGGEAEYDNDTGPCDEGFWEWVECLDCGAKADSVEQWNTRHTPEGWQLVPVEPTQEMGTAGRLAAMSAQGGYGGPSIWDAMLAAAPKWGGE